MNGGGRGSFFNREGKGRLWVGGIYLDGGGGLTKSWSLGWGDVLPLISSTMGIYIFIYIPIYIYITFYSYF